MHSGFLNQTSVEKLSCLGVNRDEQVIWWTKFVLDQKPASLNIQQIRLSKSTYATNKILSAKPTSHELVR